MPENGRVRDYLDVALQFRIEATGLVVALTFGGFTILTLFENTQVFSATWSVLSLAYLFVIIGILLMVTHWVTHSKNVDTLFNHLKSESEKQPTSSAKRDEEKVIQPTPSQERFIDRHFITMLRIVLIVMSIALWASLAFHCGFGGDDLLNPACSWPAN